MKRPNIIILMGDEHPVFYAGCYGNGVVRTPNIDGLAGNGAVFDGAYCASPICAPCRAAMMTSRYVHDIEVWDNASPLRSDWPTFAHDFQAAGYRTVLCGKMHFVGPDQRHGFAERWMSDIYPATFEWTYSNRKGVPVHHWGQQVGMVLEAGPGRSHDMDYDDLVCARAEAGLRSALRSSDAAPLLAVVSFTSPHFPFKAPSRYYDMYRDEDIRLPELPEDFKEREHAYITGVRQRGRFHEPVPDDVCRRARRSIMGRTTMLDEYIGRIMDVLSQSGRSDETFVIYTSDHGDMLGEHGLWYKNTAYEWSSRVPLVVRGPGIDARRIRETVSLHDLGPTAAGLAGIQRLDYPRVGRDLAPMLRSERMEETGEAIIENYGEGVHRGVRTIVRGKWKLTNSAGAEPELFDLDSDPGEWMNLADDPRFRDVRDELESALYASWGNPDEHDEKRYQSEERRLAVMECYRRQDRRPPQWKASWDTFDAPGS